MSWDHIREQVKRLANQAAAKVNRSADIASLQFKLTAANRKLEEAYTALGKAAYQHFSGGKATQSEKISAAMKTVNDIKREISELKAQIESLKRSEEASESAEKNDSDDAARATDAPNASDKKSNNASAKPTSAAEKKADPPLGDDFSMSVNISSNSAESDGAINLDWN